MKMLSALLLVASTAFALGCGYGTPATTPAQPGVTPTITQLSPNSVNHGAATFVMTVNGTNFSTTSAVNWNGSGLTTSFVTASQLTAMVPNSAIASAGSVTVSVTNPAVMGGIYGGGTLAETSNNMTFTIN